MAETRHARNVEHFEQLIAFVDGYGADYKPSNAVIEEAALTAKLSAAQGAIDDVSAKLAPWKVKVNDRETAYASPLKTTNAA